MEWESYHTCGKLHTIFPASSSLVNFVLHYNPRITCTQIWRKCTCIHNTCKHIYIYTPERERTDKHIFIVYPRNFRSMRFHPSELIRDQPFQSRYQPDGLDHLPCFSCSRLSAACSRSFRTRARRAKSLASSISDFNFKGSVTARAAASASFREGLNNWPQNSKDYCSPVSLGVQSERSETDVREQNPKVRAGHRWDIYHCVARKPHIITLTKIHGERCQLKLKISNFGGWSPPFEGTRFFRWNNPVSK